MFDFFYCSGTFRHYLFPVFGLLHGVSSFLCSAIGVSSSKFLYVCSLPLKYCHNASCGFGIFTCARRVSSTISYRWLSGPPCMFVAFRVLSTTFTVSGSLLDFSRDICWFMLVSLHVLVATFIGCPDCIVCHSRRLRFKRYTWGFGTSYGPTFVFRCKHLAYFFNSVRYRFALLPRFSPPPSFTHHVV